MCIGVIHIIDFILRFWSHPYSVCSNKGSCRCIYILNRVCKVLEVIESTKKSSNLVVSIESLESMKIKFLVKMLNVYGFPFLASPYFYKVQLKFNEYFSSLSDCWFHVLKITTNENEMVQKNTFDAGKSLICKSSSLYEP